MFTITNLNQIIYCDCEQLFQREDLCNMKLIIPVKHFNNELTIIQRTI